MKRIINRINKDAKLLKSINAVKYYGVEQFCKDAVTYIKAIRQGRMNCVIEKVSASGMSRIMSFTSCEMPTSKDSKAWYRQYGSFFRALGYSEVKGYSYGSIKVRGCGMNMVFHVNYTVIHDLHRLGFLTDQDCRNLAQQTPTVL